MPANTTTTAEPPLTDAGEGMCWPEDVAAALGGVTAHTIRKMLSESRRRHGRDHAGSDPAPPEVRPRDLPLPVDTVKRQLTTESGTIATTWSPRWDEAVIAEFAANRPGRGGPGQSRSARVPAATA